MLYSPSILKHQPSAHFVIRAQPRKSNGNRDSITIGGGEHPVHDIRVENVSVSWSVDENVDIAGNAENFSAV